MEAISPTVLVSIPSNSTTPKTTIMATKEAGITRLNFGSPQIMNIVRATNASNTYMVGPVSQAPEGSLNWSNCDINITSAKPFTNPNITGCGTRRINLPSLSEPAAT